MKKFSRSTIFSLIVTAIYGLVAMYKSLHHAFWEDEWQQWLTARSQNSVLAVASCSRYDGHPPFWYLVQYVITRFTHDPVWLKITHVAIACGVVYVIWKYGPFTLLEKILLPLGYFFFFEYSTISRCYVAGVLLALIAVAMARTSRRWPILLSLMLLWLGQITLFGMVVSAAIAMGVMVDWWKDPPRRWWAMPLIMAISLLLFYFTTRLPPDAIGVDLWVNGLKNADPSVAGAHLFDAYLPLPQFTKHWWNTQLIPLSDGIRSALGLAMLIVAALALRRSRGAMAMLVGGSIVTFGALLFVYTGSMRHWGHYFVILILAVWMERATRPPGKPTWGDRAFVGLLIIQAFAGMVASVMDLRQPFSATPQAARIINQIGPNLPIAGDYDYVMNALAGELNRQVYFIRSGEFRWFTRFDMRRRNPDYPMLDAAVTTLSAQFHSDVLLVLTYPLTLPRYFEPLVIIPPGTVDVEKFYIYRYRWKGENSPTTQP